MFKILVTIILLISSVVFADDWTPIAPLDYCPEFKIEFKKINQNLYEVKIPDPNQADLFETKQLPNINDLSSLTDEIVIASAQICSDSKEIVEVGNGYILYNEEDPETYDTYECKQPYLFTDEYLNLMRDLVVIIREAEGGDRCAQVAQYVELQTKINQLREEELVEPHSSRNLFHLLIKLFTGDDTDHMVDLYKTCGGKKGSDLFVTNSILLVARDSCIMPKPPGLLSFEQAQNIARSVGSEFRKFSLMKLNKRQDRITKRATMAFVDAVLKAEVDGLIGPYIDNQDEFISGLNSYQELNQMEVNDEAMDYISYGFSIDATVEVAEQSIPILIENSFKDKLPENWDAQRRKQFIEDKILPSSYEKYNLCMQTYLDRIRYGEPDSMETRMKLKEQYCVDHPDECLENSCDGSVNLLSGDPNVSDAKVVQGCVMESIFTSIKPLLKSLIEDQKEAFKDDFDLNEEKVKIFTERTWDVLVDCSTKSVLQAQRLNPDDYSKDEITHNRELLQNTLPNDFEEIVGSCAEVAEAAVSRDFVTQLLLNTPELMDAFPDDELVQRDGQMYPKLLVDKVDVVIRGAFDPCLAKQSYIRYARPNDENFTKTNPLLCTPHVEMAAASIVINKSLVDTLDQYGLKESIEGANALVQFDNCTREALFNANDSLGIPRGTEYTPINNEEDATSYLDNNNDFYTCAENSIVNISEIVTGQTIDQMAIDMKDKLQNISYLKGLKDDAQNIVGECFRNTMQEEAGNWKKFATFNANGGLNSMQTKCEQAATEYILPKVIVRETGSLLLSLKDQGVIEDNTEVGNIIARSAWQLRRDYGISLPEGIDKSEIINYSLAQAYRLHMEKEGNDIDSFVAEFEGIAMSKSVNSIHNYIKTLVNQRAKPQNLDDFFDSISPQCVVKVYSKFKPEITEFIDTMNEMPKDPDSVELIEVIIQTIVDSVNYSKGLGADVYREQKAALANVCKSIDSYNSPKELADSGAFDFIIKTTVQNEVIETFENLAIDQCKQDLKKITPKATNYQLKQSCQWSDPYNRSLSRNSLRSKTSSKNEIEFIFDRFDKMKTVIDDHLKDSKSFESSVFTNNSVEIVNEQFDRLNDSKKDCEDDFNGYLALYTNLGDSALKFCDPFASDSQRAVAKSQIMSSLNNSYLLTNNSIMKKAIVQTVENFDNDIKSNMKTAQNVLGSNCVNKMSRTNAIVCVNRQDTVTDIIYDNFMGVMTKDEKTSNLVNGEVVKRLFQQMNKDSFADDFAQVQLVSGLGIAGYTQARDSITPESVDDSVGGWDWAVNKNKVAAKSKAVLKRLWTPDEINKRIAWADISDAQRHRLIGTMYEHSVKPAAIGTQANDDAAADAVTNHVTYYIYENGLSFSDDLSEDIAEEVKSNWGSILGIEW